MRCILEPCQIVQLIFIGCKILLKVMRRAVLKNHLKCSKMHKVGEFSCISCIFDTYHLCESFFRLL